MPPAPELAYGCGCIRQVEVFGEVISQDFPHADRHIGIAGEIKIDLHAKGDNADPCHDGRDRSGIHGKNLVHVFGKNIRKDYFFAQPLHKPDHALTNTVGICRKAFLAGQQVHVFCNIAVSDNRPRNKLRKHGNIQRNLCDVLLRLRMIPVNIDYVGHALKGEEGNPDRKRHMRKRKKRQK